MEDALNFKPASWPSHEAQNVRTRPTLFVGTLILCTVVSAVLASWVPLQLSIVTVFLFAGPHNWFELRYFFMRLPLRFGKSRNFFLTAFIGLGVLIVTYVSLPVLYSSMVSDEEWLKVLAIWNSLLLAWLGILALLRGKHKSGSNWLWVGPVVLAICAFNWLKPELFSLALVYVHPLIALWFLDRHIARHRPKWLRAYRRVLCLVPVGLVLMIWQLSQTSALAEDNGLFWRITQHAGAQLLPGVSSHLLVSVHLFLEMLHYGVWLFAIPLLGPMRLGPTSREKHYKQFWSLRSIPVARHPRGFPKLIAAALCFGVVVVLVLWIGFSIDYATTRDLYFTFAIAHVIAEAPFLMRML